MKSFINFHRESLKLKNVILLSILQLVALVPSINSYAQSRSVADKPTESNSQQTQADSTIDRPASDQSDITVLPVMTIKSEESERARYVAKRTLTVTKTDTPIVEIPQSVSVITRNELDVRNVQNLTEALRYVPGVTADNFGFEGRGYEYLLMRGFSALTTATFRDGLSQAAQGLYFNSFITETYGLERIDVLRGPSSVMFGRGDAGGIVNRVTKRPSADPIREIELQYGNFDRKRVAADLGFANEDETLMFRLVGLGLDTDTQIKFPNTGGDRAQNRRFYMAPSLTWRPTIDTTITLLGDVLNNRSEASPFYISAPDGSRTDVLVADSKFVKYATNQYSFSYQIEHNFNKMFTVRQNFRHMGQGGQFNEINPLEFNIDQPTVMDRMAFSTRERLNQTVLDTHLQAKLNTGPVHHTMLLGADWNATDASIKYLAGSDTPGIDILNPVYPQPIAKPDSLADHTKQEIDQLGFYIQDQLRYNQNWILTLSGRYDRVASINDDLLNATTLKSKDSAYTGRAGLTYLFSNGIAPYISYSQSFLPQAGSTSDNLPFDPTRGAQYEVGIKYQPVGGRGLYTLALFDLTKTNVVTRDPNDLFRSVQTGEIRSRGAELEARAELLRGLNFIGSFTYYEATVTKSNDGNKGKMPIQTPTTMTSAWLDYSLESLGIDWLRGFGIGGGVRYVGRVFDDEQNTSSTPAFTLFDASLRYDYGPWLFNINANNIFNNSYVSSNAFGNYYLGAQRTVIGTLKFRI